MNNIPINLDHVFIMINGETDLETNLIIWRKTFGESKRYGGNSDTFLFPVFLVMRYRFTRRETLS